MSYKNEVGLFIGLLSYPFDLDGRKFYNKIIVDFFETHRDFLHKYDNCRSKRIDDELLYKPTGYRLFGTQGLAVLSLVDDYSFFTRVFNKNHIQTILNKKSCHHKDSSFIKKFHFSSIVTSGVMESISDSVKTLTLKDKAKGTFLKNGKEKHSFIGIIRLKIDPRVLTKTNDKISIVKQGIAVTKNIQTAINKINEDCKRNGYISADSDYICVDCFDNDEMTVIAFANDLLSLYNFLGEIRSLKCSDIEQEYKIGDTILKEKHVFASTLLCFGYDIEKIELEKDTFESDKRLEDFFINCLIESKTGHRDSLFEYLKQLKNPKDITKKPLELFGDEIRTNITGGCNIIAKVPLKKIEKLEEFCETNEVFKYHTRKVKISLPDIYDSDKRKVKYADFESTKYENEKGLDIGLNELRENLKTLGVSKALRDRAMALFELYDNACRNLLQQFYMEELEGALEPQFSDLIKELGADSSESLYDIEETVNKYISNIECAIYDRLHQQKYNQHPLEYNGGIQQYLTIFDKAYKTIVSALGRNDIKNKEKVYVTITGTERASSERNLLRLNINHIVYPELFAYAAWKEASNYTIEALKGEQYEGVTSKYPGVRHVLLQWNKLLDNKNKEPRILDEIKYRLLHDIRFDYSNPVHSYIYSKVSNEMMSYFVQDIIVLHFTFLYKYELMWHTYLKNMLQTTICYYRLNKIDKQYLIYELLRLFMVYRVYCKEIDKVQKADLEAFISKQKETPFDAAIGEAWVECFQKTLDISEIIYDIVEKEGILELCRHQIGWIEDNIYSDNPHDVLNRRCNKSIEFKSMMEKGEVIFPEENDHPVDYLICLLNAYLEAIKELDCPDEEKQYPIKSVTRTTSDGSILNLTSDMEDELNSRMSNILADPTGGFFTRTAETRQKYFTYRTVLYRSLWNFRFTSNK